MSANRPLDHDLVDAWLEFDPEGTLTVYAGKVELGTGIQTALAQVVAEELDVPLDRVRMVLGDTARTPDQGTTAGSKTIQSAGPVLRQAAAEARRILLHRAAARLGAPVDSLTVENGTVRAPTGAGVTYGDLAGGQPFREEITGTAPLKPRERYTVVGTSAPRLDLRAKLTGGPAFVHDVTLPGMLHGRVIRPHRRTPAGIGGHLEAVDDSALDGLPGIVAVVRNGSFVGVVAEREEQAIAAAAALRVTWRDPPDLPRHEDEHDRLRAAPADPVEAVRHGDPARVLRAASVTHAATYRQPWQAHATMGPSCAVAEVRNGHATIHASTQSVTGLAAAIAPLLRLPPNQVRVIYHEGAGCYGHSGSDDVAADAALLAQAVGKPVRVQWSRQHEFAWEPKGPAMLTDLRAALDATGAIAAWEAEVYTPTHSARPNGEPSRLLAGQQVEPPFPPAPSGWRGGGDRNAVTTYDLPTQAVSVHWTGDPPIRQSSLRSLGGFHNTTANEGFIDELAHRAGADPIAYRKRHLTDPRAHAVLDEVARISGWVAQPRSSAPRVFDGILRGRGVAFVRYETEWTYVATVAGVEVNPATGEIRVRRVWVAHDCGQVVNPDGVRNQVEGNILQGLSRALKEEVTWDTAAVTTLTWADYPILTFPEVPELTISLVDRPEEPAWGAGEPAICTAAAAVSNAVFNATGARLRTIPYTPERVLDALRETRDDTP